MASRRIKKTVVAAVLVLIVAPAFFLLWARFLYMPAVCGWQVKNDNAVLHPGGHFVSLLGRLDAVKYREINNVPKYESALVGLAASKGISKQKLLQALEIADKQKRLLGVPLFVESAQYKNRPVFVVVCEFKYPWFRRGFPERLFLKPKGYKTYSLTVIDRNSDKVYFFDYAF